jgi:hypothetical protein
MLRKIVPFLVAISTSCFLLNDQTVNADILVYDSQENYLGVLLGSPDTHMSVYNPAIDRFFVCTRHERSGKTDIQASVVYFTGDDCRGTAYLGSSETLYGPFIVKNGRGQIYETVRTKRDVAVRSYIHESDGNCYVSFGAIRFDSAVEVNRFETELPFETPFTLPFQFMYRRGAVAVIPLP